MGKKILLVEDNQDYAALLERVLTKEGFAVTVLYEGTQAVKRAQQEKPDLIILDVMLPDVSGLSVLEEIKRNEATKPIPVFCLTNLPEEVGREKAFALGAYTYLTKVHYNIYDMVKRIQLYFRENS